MMMQLFFNYDEAKMFGLQDDVDDIMDFYQGYLKMGELFYKMKKQII